MRKWPARFHSGHGSKTSSILTRSDLLTRQDHSMLDDPSPQGWPLLSLSPRGQRGLPQPLDKALKLPRRRFGSPFGTTPAISWRGALPDRNSLG